MNAQITAKRHLEGLASRIEGNVETRKDRKEIAVLLRKHAATIRVLGRPSKNGLRELISTLDYLSGTDVSKIVAKRWGFEKDESFRQVVRANRLSCELMMSLLGAKKSRDWVSKTLKSFCDETAPD